MKIVYIAHPISGNILENLKKIIIIIRELNLKRRDIIPFAHYFVDCYALHDSIPFERKRGIKNDKEFFRRKIFDELWLYGDRISDGMWDEIKLATSLNIPIYAKSKETKKALITKILKLKK